MGDDIEGASGGCYCGRVRYRAARASRAITECHCSQCRRQSGHRYAVTHTHAGDVAIEGAGNITWFRASPAAERGFCSTCGAHLFWRSSTDDEMGILAASLDDARGFRMAEHIFVADKGAYYEIDDGLPQFPGDAPDPAP